MTDVAATEVAIDLNNLARVTTTFQVDSVDTDPTAVTLTTRDPNGTIVTYTYVGGDVIRDAQGVYHVDIAAITAGTWYWAFRGTGACVAQVEGDFFIWPTGVAAQTNTLATLTAKLATALNDDGTADLDEDAFQTWNSTELDTIVGMSVATLYPRYCRLLDPTLYTITLVASTYFYNVPTGVVSVNRLDRVQSDGTEAGPVSGLAWEIVGDLNGGTAKIHVSPQIVDGFVGDTIRINGYGAYDTSSNPVSDSLSQLVLARARAEAYRRIAGDRTQFEQWLSRNQVQNVSVNELLQYVRDAQAEANRLEAALPRTQMIPVQARL